MQSWPEYLGRILLMCAFLCGSAYCSGTETAFFSLSKRQVNRLRETKPRFGTLVANLLNKPTDLLGSLLLGNLIVNTLFFATSSVLIVKVEHDIGVVAAAIMAPVTFFCLVLFGEILPKSISYGNPERVSVWVALPTTIVVRLLTPVVTMFQWLIADPALRILIGKDRKQHNVTAGEFKNMIKATQERGLINERQAHLFSDVVTFNLLRVRHVMRSRMDMAVCSVNQDSSKAQRIMLDHCVTSLIIYKDQIDNVLGFVKIRDLVLAPERSLEELLQPVQFVPEQQTVESLLQFFRKRRADTAVVVDEYGGVAGSVSVEDVAEELFGPLQAHDVAEMVEKLSPGCYRISGSLPIHDWTKAFGLQPDRTDATTVGGWITGLLGRIPQKDDVARWRNITLTVERMQRYRVESVIMTLEKDCD